jgi:hypothetical protein
MTVLENAAAAGRQTVPVRRSVYRVGAVATLLGVVAGIVVTVVLELGVQDPFGDVPTLTYLKGILAARNVWLVVHLVFAFVVLLKLVGLLSLGDILEQGPARPLARAAGGLAICGAAMFLITMVHDGYLHEYLATSWEQANAATRPEWVPIFAEGVRDTLGTELGSLAAMTGLAPIGYGLAILLGSRLPRWVGWLGVVGGIGAVFTTGYLWMTGNTDLGYAVLYPVFATLLPLIWYVAIAVLLWRRGGAAGGQPVNPPRHAPAANRAAY